MNDLIIKRPSKQLIRTALHQLIEANGWQVLWAENSNSSRKVYKAR